MQPSHAVKYYYYYYYYIPLQLQYVLLEVLPRRFYVTCHRRIDWSSLLSDTGCQ